MLFSFSTALPLLSILPSLTAAQQSTGGNNCQIFEPTSAYAIFSDNTTKSQDQTFSPDPDTANTTGKPFDFELIQRAPDAGGEVDLVVFFTDLNCSGAGPFSFEFNFNPDYVLVKQGQGQINMFRVEPATGSLLGTFALPEDGQPRVHFLNQLVCQPTIVLRFGIARDSGDEGVVVYVNANGFGLRDRNGC